MKSSLNTSPFFRNPLSASRWAIDSSVRWRYTAPALLSGSTIVIKPSPETPLVPRTGVCQSPLRRIVMRAAFATTPGDGAIDFRAEFRRRHSNVYYRLDAKISSIELPVSRSIS